MLGVEKYYGKESSMGRFEETWVGMQVLLVIRMVRVGLFEKIKFKQILEEREGMNCEDIIGSKFTKEETANTNIVRHGHV